MDAWRVVLPIFKAGKEKNGREMGKRSRRCAFFVHTCLENCENHYNIKACVGTAKENDGIIAQLCQIEHVD